MAGYFLFYIYIKNSVHSTPFINKNIQDTADTTLYVYLLKKKERVNMVNSVLRILKLKGVCVDCTHLLMDLFSGILLGRIIMRGTAKCTENQNWAPKVGNFMFDHGMANHLIFIISVCHWGARNYFLFIIKSPWGNLIEKNIISVNLLAAIVPFGFQDVYITQLLSTSMPYHQKLKTKRKFVPVQIKNRAILALFTAVANKCL
jgi:hypothetical protein